MWFPLTRSVLACCHHRTGTLVTATFKNCGDNVVLSKREARTESGQEISLTVVDRHKRPILWALASGALAPDR
jgi:hypothetical protein